MPRVTFIELKIASRDRLICDVIEKLYTRNNRVIVYFSEKDKAIHMDNLLWTWKQESFVPHGFNDHSGNFADKSVLLTTDQNLPEGSYTLVLYDPLPADQLASCETVIDFAEVHHPERLNKSRQRYKQLRDDERFELKFFPLGAFLKT
jgi:DNA polymerase-3 subunit chi